MNCTDEPFRIQLAAAVITRVKTKLIAKRFAKGLCDAILRLGLLPILLILLLCGALYLISPYECAVRQALGLPVSRTVDPALHPRPRERDCETEDGNTGLGLSRPLKDLRRP